LIERYLINHHYRVGRTQFQQFKILFVRQHGGDLHTHCRHPHAIFLQQKTIQQRRQMFRSREIWQPLDTCFPTGSGYPAFADLMQNLLEPVRFSFSRAVVPE